MIILIIYHIIFNFYYLSVFISTSWMLNLLYYYNIYKYIYFLNIIFEKFSLSKNFISRLNKSTLYVIIWSRLQY